MKSIASRANPAFKVLRALVRDARQAQAQGLAFLEGAHLVETYRQRIGPPRQLILSASAAGRAEGRALIDACQRSELLVLDDVLFDQLSSLATPAGIAALIEIPSPKVSLAGTPSGVVPDMLLLDAVQDAGNVGALLRTAAAAGVDEIWLGPGCAHVWGAKVLRAAQGAHFALCLHEQADLAAVLRNYSGQTVAAVAHEGVSLYALNLKRPTAWLFGNEGQGPAPGLVALAQYRTTIPQASGVESLNVAAAAAVCLFERRRVAPPSSVVPCGGKTS